jgi:hypothetical protein
MVGFDSATPSVVIRGRNNSTGSQFDQVAINGLDHVGLPASTESRDLHLNLARTVTFNAGALANQRAVLISAPTYAFSGASTITNAATLAVTGAPVAGANATITNPYAFWVQGGNSRLDGNTRISGQLGVNGASPSSAFGIWTQGTYGLYATGTSGGNAVHGDASGTANGVWGFAGGSGVGVYGSAASSIGVYGTGPQGVYGNSSSPGGVGTSGYSSSNSGSAGLFINGASGNNAYLATYQGGVPYAGYFSGNANITGNLTVGGTITGAGMMGGTGTAGYVARFTAASTLANSVIRDDGSTVAIGNAPAAGALLAVGPTSLSNAIIGTTNAASGVGVYGFGLGSSSIGLYGQGTGAGVFGLGGGASGVGLQGTGNYAGVTGTTANVWGYGVQGSVPAGSYAYGVYGITPSTIANSAGVAGLSTSAGMGGYFQASQAGSIALYAYNGASGSAFYANGTSQFTGNVGIGTAPTANRLDVSGTVRINSGTLAVNAAPDAQRSIFVNVPTGGINAIYASGAAGTTPIQATGGGNSTVIMGNNQAGNGIGVYGFSQNGYGLRGQADSAGGYGTYSTGYQAGVYGSSSTGYGLQGVSTAASGWGIMGTGTQYGIVGYTASANGSAYFYNGSGDGYAYLSKGTTAGHFLATASGLGLLVESGVDLTGAGTGGKIKVRDTGTAKYMLFDDNEIQAFDAAAAPSFLHVNNDGGTIVLTGGAAGAVGVGTTAPAYKLTVAGDIYANGGWVRVSGNQGIYFESYGGGWYMEDGTWIRSYNNKPTYMSAGFDTGSASGVGCGGGMGGAFTFRVCGTLGFSGSSPRMFIYDTCCSSPDQNILAHSPSAPSWGLWYQDNGDRLVVRSARFAITTLDGTGAYNYLCYRNEQPSGSTFAANNVGTCGSSIRYKKDVTDLDLGLETVMKLRPREFTWKNEGNRDLGFIAEEIEKVDPLLAVYLDGRVESVKYPQLTALLAKAMQELNMRVEGMEVKYDERLDDAEERIRELEERVKALEARLKDL